MLSAFTRVLGLIGLICSCTPATPVAQEPAPPAPATTSTPAPTTPPSDSAAGGGPTGPAAPAEKMCGGIAGIRCPEKQYCNYPPEAHCGAADMSGTCAPIPEACTQQYDPVCGCGDKTYGNACAAAQAGVSVMAKGECAPTSAPTGGGSIAEGQLCGTRGVPGNCADGLYCAYKSDCGATDTGGSCKKKPPICTKIYKPVCGCDNKTYGSDCTAAAAGISTATPGPCPKK